MVKRVPLASRVQQETQVFRVPLAPRAIRALRELLEIQVPKVLPVLLVQMEQLALKERQDSMGNQVVLAQRAPRARPAIPVHRELQVTPVHREPQVRQA